MQKKGFCWFITIYLLILLGAALVAPLFYNLVIKLNSIFQISWLHYLAEKPLSQYIDRLRIVGVICMIPYLLKVTQITWKDLALNLNFKIYLRCFLQGCLLWICLLVCIVLATHTFQIREYGSLSILKLFFSSLVLAFVEELIFRGFIFEFLHKKYSFGKSATLLAFLFAILHFSLCQNGKANDLPLLLQSLQCAWNSIIGIWGNIHWPYFWSLVLLSKILIYLRFYYNSLWASIGLHQGLIFTLMAIRKIFYFNEGQNTFWGTGRLTDAWFVVLILFFICQQLKLCLKKYGKLSKTL